MVGQLPQVLLFLAISFLLLAFVLAFSLSSSWLFLLLIPSAACFGLRRLAIRRLQRLKLMETLRGRWGAREVQKERDFQRIAAFFRSNQRPGVIDDRTWQDLTMDTVFSRLDRTLTWPGVQVLYSLLRTPETDELDRLEQRKQVISAFERQDAVRERVQVILSGLQGRGGS